jgi:hypothetical protein
MTPFHHAVIDLIVVLWFARNTSIMLISDQNAKLKNIIAINQILMLVNGIDLFI